jgi:four helix bundle protein
MNYRELKAWQQSVELSVTVFETVRTFPYRESRDLSEQMRSASISIPSNVAEACGRFSFRDQRQFIIRSRGSLLELETQIEISRRLRFLSPGVADRLLIQTSEIGKLLNGLIRYLSRRAREGSSRSRRRPSEN